MDPIFLVSSEDVSSEDACDDLQDYDVTLYILNGLVGFKSKNVSSTAMTTYKECFSECNQN